MMVQVTHAAAAQQQQAAAARVTHACDLNQLLAAIGTNYLPQVQNTPPISGLNLSDSLHFGTPIAESANWKLNLAESSDSNLGYQFQDTQEGKLQFWFQPIRRLSAERRRLRAKCEQL